MADNFNLLDQNLQTNTSKTSSSVLQSIAASTITLVSAANARKSHVIVQASSAIDVFINGDNSGGALTISGTAGSVFPNAIELRTQGDVYVNTVSPGFITVTEFFN